MDISSKNATHRAWGAVATLALLATVTLVGAEDLGVGQAGGQPHGFTRAFHRASPAWFYRGLQALLLAAALALLGKGIVGLV